MSAADQAWATATNKLLNQYISQLIAHGESPSIQDAIIKHVEDTLVPWIASFDQPRKQHKSEFRRSRLRIDGPTIDLLKASALNRMGQLKAGQLCENIIRGEEQLSEPDQDFLTVRFLPSYTITLLTPSPAVRHRTRRTYVRNKALHTSPANYRPPLGPFHCPYPQYLHASHPYLPLTRPLRRHPKEPGHANPIIPSHPH